MAGRQSPAPYSNNALSPIPRSVPIPRVSQVAAKQPTGYNGQVWPGQAQQNLEVPVKLNINGVTVTNGPKKEQLPNC